MRSRGQNGEYLSLFGEDGLNVNIELKKGTETTIILNKIRRIKGVKEITSFYNIKPYNPNFVPDIYNAIPKKKQKSPTKRKAKQQKGKKRE